MYYYRPDISFGRIIENLPPDHMDRLDEAYILADSSLSVLMKDRLVLRDEQQPMIRLVHENEMLALQKNIGQGFDDAAEEAVWTAVRRNLPAAHFQPRTVSTWPGEVIVRRFPDKEVYLGADRGLIAERDVMLGALQIAVQQLYGAASSVVRDSWDQNFVPGYHIATVDQPNSERAIAELVKAAQQPDILPARLVTRGVQLVTALRNL